MSLQSKIRNRLTGAGGNDPRLLVDLSAWHRRLVESEGAESPWRGETLPQIYRELGLPIWQVARPWKVEYPGLHVRKEATATARTLTVETASGPLVWRWQRDSDGIWQQRGYPVTGAADLPAAVLWARAQSYSLDTAGLTEMEAEIGSDGVLVIELPAHPATQVARDLIGWERASSLLGEPAIALILEALANSHLDLVTALAQLAPTFMLSPDDLGAGVFPTAFLEDYVLPAYSTTVAELGEYRKKLLVRSLGPVDGIAEALLTAGISGLTNVAADGPGSSAGAISARLGERLVLWGGISAAALCPPEPPEAFQRAVQEAAADSAGHSGVLLGLAGPLPLNADLDRLRSVSQWLLHESGSESQSI
ncbi:MAG: hypothetical protein GXX94_03870 [Chloroflexi bacterium]|nr:hypothetical protein [Chloroflexota bacterium]